MLTFICGLVIGSIISIIGMCIFFVSKDKEETENALKGGVSMCNSFFYRKPDAPCKCCEDRRVGCHSICEKYAKWVEEEKAISDKIIAKKSAENLKVENEIKKCIKRNKMYWKHRK